MLLSMVLVCRFPVVLGFLTSSAMSDADPDSSDEDPSCSQESTAGSEALAELPPPDSVEEHLGGLPMSVSLGQGCTPASDV